MDGAHGIDGQRHDRPPVGGSRRGKRDQIRRSRIGTHPAVNPEPGTREEKLRAVAGDSRNTGGTCGRSRQRQLQLFRVLGMPLAPEGEKKIRHPAAQGAGAVDARMAGGADRDQSAVIARPPVVHMQNDPRVAAGAALPAVPFQSAFAVPAKGARRVPCPGVTGGAESSEGRKRSAARAKKSFLGGSDAGLPCPGGIPGAGKGRRGRGSGLEAGNSHGARRQRSLPAVYPIMSIIGNRK